jgi:hypothetical protein
MNHAKPPGEALASNPREKPSELRLVETAAAILAKALIVDTKATAATIELEGLTYKGKHIGSFRVRVEPLGRR